MKRLIFILLFLAIAAAGCRCVKHAASSSVRNELGFIDARSRSLSQLWDTCAERQTIRIEYYLPPEEPGRQASGQSAQTATADIGSACPTDTGGSRAQIKSIEIVTERNTGSSLTTAKDSTMLSENSTGESLQEEQSSEARQDNGTWIGIAVVCAVVALLYFIINKMLP